MGCEFIVEECLGDEIKLLHIGIYVIDFPVLCYNEILKFDQYVVNR